jgi:hypothetical protein
MMLCMRGKLHRGIVVIRRRSRRSHTTTRSRASRCSLKRWQYARRIRVGGKRRVNDAFGLCRGMQQCGGRAQRSRWNRDFDAG